METVYLKRKATCRYCGEEILLGEPAFKLWKPVNRSSSWAKKRSWWKCYHYHWGCYKKLGDEWFNQNIYVTKKRKKRKVHTPKKRGRPTKAIGGFSVYRRGLLSLRSYHLRQGNIEKVEELTQKINAVTVQEETI